MVELETMAPKLDKEYHTPYLFHQQKGYFIAFMNFCLSEYFQPFGSRVSEEKKFFLKSIECLKLNILMWIELIPTILLGSSFSIKITLPLIHSYIE